ncbi:hypothetical protein A3A69_01630 [candidate division WWE3 bacterium RIFCSPLOWO2_01_FULL_37_15]|uniref:DNA-3-methyladenine glycosylase II n=1 Tax=candidate division WWE3 bacterium RIFCSPLOWO2_01_FULL_37_15 TaxID=1802622 RepID=A0A1F4V0N1_UNCKA|nr:MAG: hypothetical protein A3A69_01630 [candidate division WWE3 bacterium RIFCSPLOWO2_01_FULL_37_15]
MNKRKHQKILDHFSIKDPEIHKIMLTVNFDEWLEPEFKKLNNNEFFLALCRTIIGQQLSGKAANTIYSRFINLFKHKKVTPKNLLKVKDQKIRDAGISWAKIKYIKDLAQKIQNGEMNPEILYDLKNEEVITELIKVKGIGNWTAEMVLIFTLNRNDVFSFGDLGLKKGLEKVYGLHNPTQKQTEKIISKWTPYKSFGSIALWHSLE